MDPLVLIGRVEMVFGIQTLGGADACRVWTLYGEAGRDWEEDGGDLRGDIGIMDGTASGLQAGGRYEMGSRERKRNGMEDDDFIADMGLTSCCG